jgi:PST family polysaccharide transporter
LVNIPTDNLNSAVGTVAFSALSRVKDDPSRLRSFFLKGYSLVLGLTVPITVMCALFAPDIVAVLLGPKWVMVVPIFRFLAPTILIFALINPMSWLLTSTGRVARSLKIAFVIAPLVIAADLIALRYGPTAVAFAYSAVMTLWLVPHILWSIQGTGVSFKDIVRTASRPILSSVVAGLAAWGGQAMFGAGLSHLVRLLLEGAIVVAVYLPMLLYVMDQKPFYLDVIRGLLQRAPIEEKAAAAAAY